MSEWNGKQENLNLAVQTDKESYVLRNDEEKLKKRIQELSNKWGGDSALALAYIKGYWRITDGEASSVKY